jgi:hypothetical protein
MPFKETSELSSDPSVRIYLTGQLILQPDADRNTCEVFVNRSAPNHRLSIEIREKKPDCPDAVLMRHHGPLEFATSLVEEGTLYGLLVTTDSSDGVFAYAGPETSEGESLDLAIKLNDAGLHATRVGAVDLEGGRPSMLLNNATFYTAAKTSPKLKIDLLQGETKVRELEPFTSLIGANISLKTNQVLKVQWREMGLLQIWTLQNPAQGIDYEIYIMNDPLYEDPDELKTHDEFREYYKLLPEVPQQEQFKLDVHFPEEHVPERGTTKTPCMPVIYTKAG